MICGPDGLDMDEDETILIEIPGGWFRTGLLWVTMMRNAQRRNPDGRA